MVFALPAELSRLLVPRGQELFDSWQRAASGGSAGIDRSVNPFEVIPGKLLHRGAKDQVGVPLPGFDLMLLRGTYGPADNKVLSECSVSQKGEMVAAVRKY